MIVIKQITPKHISHLNINQVNNLISQLSSSFIPHTPSSFAHFLSQPCLYQYAAFDGQKLTGLASLFVIQKIERKTGLVEGVVVDQEYRGQGIGTKLVKAVIKKAKQLKLHHLELTSHPRRIPANRLYQKQGFAKRTTNVYRLVIQK